MRSPLLAATLVALAFAGCLSGDEAPVPAAAPQEIETSDATLRALEETFTGTVGGTPVQPDVAEFPFRVPQGAVGVNGTLTWTAPVERMRFELVDPTGEVVDTGYRAQKGMMVVATVEPPRSGEWTYRVIGQTPAPVEFTLHAVAELLVPQDNEVVKSVTLRGGAGFYELNVIMEENATFTYGFNASEAIKWDVHSHFNGKTEYWARGEDVSVFGNFTAHQRGIYSLMLHNENALPVDVTLEMRGAFRLHSHVQ